MAIQSGIFFFDMRPVRSAGDVLTDGLVGMSRDGVTTHSQLGIAMAFGARDVWHGNKGVRQPHRGHNGTAITWDGRLDNRRDLFCRCYGSQRSDIDIVAERVARYGTKGFRDLIGDWAIAMWDPTTRTLRLARDYMGTRPLYYLWTPEWVAWSSCLGELARRTGRDSEISDAFAAAFIARRTSVEVTPYKGIRAVPAATCLTFSSDGGHTRERHWDLTPTTVRYRDSRQYEDHLRDLWADAVSARLATTETVWAELSGGLDSSSVVCMAHALIRSGYAPAPGLRLVSHATLQSPEGDERRFIAEVEARVGVRSEVVGVEQHQSDRDATRHWITPFALSGVGLACVERMRADGGHVMLSGRCGDAVMGAQFDNSVAVFDERDDRGAVAALAALRAWSRSTRRPFIDVARQLIRDRNARHRREPDATRREQADAGLQLLTANLRRHLPDAVDVSAVMKEIRPAKRHVAQLVLAYADGCRLQMPSYAPDVFYTYPFTHRPLVEFVLGIPGHELSAPGRTRNLMRRAFADIVPSRNLQRQSKGNYPPAMLRSMRPAAAMLRVDSLEVVRRGWIDAHRLQEAVRGLVDGTKTTSLEVRSVLRLEEWLTTRQRSAVGIPERKEVTSHEIRNA